MEIEVKEQGVNSTKDDFPEEFQCCICLDLVYKPVVVACGHMACFWCIFIAMDFCEGCPVCRIPYNYFPRICRVLHLMLRKSYPSAYARREKEVSEEEDKSGNVSQQFDDHNEDSDSVICELPSDSLKSVTPEDNKYNMTTKIVSETARDVYMWENGQTACGKLQDRLNMEVVMSDLTCAICKQLLCRPVVLNCGDVYCEACMVNSSDTTCQVCQIPHPNGLPNVCWVLEHFLERQFPEEYADRRESILEHLRPSRGSNKPDDSSSPVNAYLSWFSGEGPTAHFAICDYCGMSPIVGKRYRCKDCKEKMSFDLCEGCYNSSCKLPGRFNQQHTEDHQFELVEMSMADAIHMLAAANGLDDHSLLFRPDDLNAQSMGSDQAPELEEGPERTPLNIDCPEDEGTGSRT